MNQSIFPTLDSEFIDPVELDYGKVTLVLVDAQEPFVAACKDPQLIPAVVAQVKLAISRGWAIVLLEVKPWTYGETVEPIMELLRGRYERFTACRKEGDDGSLQVLEACRSRLAYPDQFFRVTGVVIGACVVRTAWGLTERKKDCRVRVIKECCATTGDAATAWAAFTEGARVVVSSHSIDEQIYARG